MMLSGSIVPIPVSATALVESFRRARKQIIRGASLAASLQQSNISH
jgi:hypothetical protein